MDTNLKIDNLKKIISGHERMLIAYSGGADSTFLTKIALSVLGKENVLAVTSVSSTFSKKEADDAKEYALLLGINHKIIHTNELEIDNFKNNPPERCYYCKKELFKELGKIASEYNFNVIADASTYDDSKTHRPGMKVARELKIVSPLYEAGLEKEEIRAISKELGLITWDKPSMACLASRFPYGKKITEKGLKMVEEAEKYLNDLGFRQIRVRCIDETARIEVDEEILYRILELKNDIIDKFKDLGFKYISLDLEGYRTGSMDLVLDKPIINN